MTTPSPRPPAPATPATAPAAAAPTPIAALTELARAHARTPRPASDPLAGPSDGRHRRKGEPVPPKRPALTVVPDAAEPCEPGRLPGGGLDRDYYAAQLAPQGKAADQLAQLLTGLRNPDASDDDVVAALLEDALVAELERAAIAENTRMSYSTHLAAWFAWCDEKKVCALPADPEQVARHLALYAVPLTKDDLAAAAQGRDLLARHAAVRPGTVELRLHAISKLHVLAGLAPLSQHHRVRTVMNGLRRSFGVRPVFAKAAIMMDGLQRMLGCVNAATVRSLQHRALALLWHHTGLTAGQAARLQWADVELGESRVTLRLPPDRRGAARRTVTLLAHHDTLLCPVTTLRELRTMTGSAWVFSAADGRALTRQTLHNELTVLRRRLPVSRRRGEQLPALLSASPHDRQPTALRDSAILLVGYAAALRSANVAALRWRDLRRHRDEWVITLASSKTDQNGEGFALLVPTADAGLPSPAAALTAWRDHVAAVIGGDPQQLLPDEPVFCAIDRHGNLRRRKNRFGRPEPLTGKALCELVQRYALKAGLDGADRDRNAYGSHSLRIGFVNQALADGISVEDIVQVTNHSIASLQAYVRQQGLGRDSTAARLFRARADGK